MDAFFLRIGGTASSCFCSHFHLQSFSVTLMWHLILPPFWDAPQVCLDPPELACLHACLHKYDVNMKSLSLITLRIFHSTALTMSLQHLAAGQQPTRVLEAAAPAVL